MKTLIIIFLTITNALCYNSLDEVISEASDGNPAALYNLGLVYYGYRVKMDNGILIGENVRKNPTRAFECFSEAAENIKNYMFADELAAKICYMLGNCYNYGIGVEKNEHMAFQAWMIGADGNNADAQYEVSKCYGEGRGIAKNVTLAKQWLNIAAQNGCLKARASQGDLGYFIGLAAKKIKEEGAPVIQSIKDGYNNNR
jgi:TPR repeat protein